MTAVDHLDQGHDSGGDHRHDSSDELRDSGTMTLWMLGLATLILAVGGLGLDLWRVVSERRALAEAADASARAGANGIDELVFDQTGEVVLDPAIATDLANDNLGLQERSTLRSLTGSDISATTEHVRVVLDGRVDTTLLRLFGAAGFELTVESEAEPQPIVPAATAADDPPDVP
jgi:Putative Flp pilus-assembly TadE/G-like